MNETLPPPLYAAAGLLLLKGAKFLHPGPCHLVLPGAGPLVPARHVVYFSCWSTKDGRHLKIDCPFCNANYGRMFPRDAHSALEEECHRRVGLTLLDTLDAARIVGLRPHQLFVTEASTPGGFGYGRYDSAHSHYATDQQRSTWPAGASIER